MTRGGVGVRLDGGMVFKKRCRSVLFSVLFNHLPASYIVYYYYYYLSS